MSTQARRRHHQAFGIDRDSWQNIQSAEDKLNPNDRNSSLIAEFGSYEKKT